MESKKRLTEQRGMEKYFLFTACTLVEKNIYAFTNINNIPIILNLQKKEISFWEDFENYNMFEVDEIINDGKNLYVFSLNGKMLLIYDLDRKTCRYNDMYCDQRDSDNYVTFAKYGKYLFAFPKYEMNVRKIDVELGIMSSEAKFYSEMDEYMERNQCEDACFACGCQSGNVVWLVHSKGNFMMVYDLEQDIWNKYVFTMPIVNCVHVVEYKKKLYMLCSNGKIYCWNIAEHCIENVYDCVEGNENEFYRIAVTDKKLFVLPSLGENIYTIDLDTGRGNLFCEYPPKFRYSGVKGWSKYYRYCEDKENYYFGMRAEFFILCIGKHDGKAKWIEPKLPSLEEYVNTCMKHKGLIPEIGFSVEELLVYVSRTSMNSFGNNSRVIGKNVWESLK